MTETVLGSVYIPLSFHMEGSIMLYHMYNSLGFWFSGLEDMADEAKDMV